MDLKDLQKVKDYAQKAMDTKAKIQGSVFNPMNAGAGFASNSKSGDGDIASSTASGMQKAKYLVSRDRIRNGSNALKKGASYAKNGGVKPAPNPSTGATSGASGAGAATGTAASANATGGAAAGVAGAEGGAAATAAGAGATTATSGGIAASIGGAGAGAGGSAVGGAAAAGSATVGTPVILVVAAVIIVVAILGYFIIAPVLSNFLTNPSGRMDEISAEKDVSVSTEVSDKYNQAFFSGAGVDDTEARQGEDSAFIKEDGSYDAKSATNYDVQQQYVKIGKIFKGLIDKAIANASKKYPITVQKALKGADPKLNALGSYLYTGGADFWNGVDRKGKTRAFYGCPLVDRPDLITILDDRSAKLYTNLPKAIAGYSVSRMDIPPWEGFFWDIKSATFFHELNEDLYKFTYDVTRRRVKATCIDKYKVRHETKYWEYTLSAKIEEGSMEKLFSIFFHSAKGKYYQMKRGEVKLKGFENPIESDILELKSGFFYPKVGQVPNDYQVGNHGRIYNYIKDDPYYPSRLQFKKDNDLTSDFTDSDVRDFGKPSIWKAIKMLIRLNKAKTQFGFAKDYTPLYVYTYKKDNVVFNGDQARHYGAGTGGASTTDLNFNITSTEFGKRCAELGMNIVKASHKLGTIGKYNQNLRYTWKQGHKGDELAPNGDFTKSKLTYFDCSSFTTYVWAVNGIKVTPQSAAMIRDFKQMQQRGQVKMIDLRHGDALAMVKAYGSPGDILVGTGHAMMVYNPGATGAQTLYIESNSDLGIANTSLAYPRNAHGMYERSANWAKESFRLRQLKSDFWLVKPIGK